MLNVDLLDQRYTHLDLFVSKTSWRRLQDMSSRRLQDMSSRRLEDQQMFAGIKRFGWLAKKKLHKKLIIFKLEHSEPYYYHYYY